MRATHHSQHILSATIGKSRDTGRALCKHAWSTRVRKSHTLVRASSRKPLEFSDNLGRSHFRKAVRQFHVEHVKPLIRRSC